MNSDGICGAAQSGCMARPRKENALAPFKATGDRVRLLRVALGEDNASAFAAKIGISPSNLSNIESGSFDLTKHVAIKMCAVVPGLTLDWLLLGNDATVTYDLGRKLAAARSNGITASSPTVRRSISRDRAET